MLLQFTFVRLKYALCLVLVLCLTSIARPQSSSYAALTGTVQDSSDARVSDATVKLISADSGRETVSHTNHSGQFILPSVLPGQYALQIEHDGFEVTRLSGIVLNVGDNRVLEVRLRIGNANETVDVTADTGEANPAVSTVVDQRSLGGLPLNGRNVSQLYLLVPGVSTSGSGTFDDMRFSGRSAEQNVIRYDGVEGGTIIDSNPGDPAGQGSSQFRLSQSLESIQEFHVESSTYAAEFGRGSGGQVTIITKSGSNDLHGRLFEYARNNVFDARNYFNNTGRQAPLHLNQFGGSVGGPLLKDRLFFFLAQENLSQRVAVNFVESTLSAAARAQAAPALRPLLPAFPIGQTSTSNPLLDIANATVSSSVNEYFGNTRLDYHINDRNSVYVRYMRDQGYSSLPKDIGGSVNVTSIVPQNAVADLTTVFTPNLVNDAKFGYNAAKGRYTFNGASVPGLDLSAVTINVGGTSSGGGATGFVTPQGGSGSALAHEYYYTNYATSYFDTLSYSHGAHLIKTGFEISPRVMYLDLQGGIGYTFTNLQTFLANQPSQVQVIGSLDESPSPFHNGYIGIRKGLQTFYGGFVQDTWKATNTLTLNYGLRYDYFSVMKEARNLGVVVNPDTGAIDTSGAPFYKSSKLNYGPRLAVAWSPSVFHNQTTFRLGGGWFFGPGQGEDEVQPIQNDTANLTLSSGNMSYPLNGAALLQNFNPYSPNAQYQPRVYSNTYSLPEKVVSYNATLEQSFPDHSVVTLGYVGSQGRNLFLRNIANRVTGVTMNPANGAAILSRELGNQFAELDVKTSGGTNHYDSLQANWHKRVAAGLTGAANYTWSHNIGTSQGSNEASTSQNNYSFAGERGDNMYDVRHTFNLGVLWDFALAHHSAVNRGGLSHLTQGWQIGASVNAKTGFPINVQISRPNALYRGNQDGKYYTGPLLSSMGQILTTPVINIPGGGQSRGTQRPDLVPGVNPYVKSAAGVWLNPAAFAIPQPGTYGNLRRDALRAPSNAQFDLTASKQFRLSDRFTTLLRVDAYNVFNHPSFAAPPATLATGIPSAPGSGLQPGQAFGGSTAGAAFGLLNSTTGNYVGLGTARQLQLALSIAF